MDRPRLAARPDPGAGAIARAIPRDRRGALVAALGRGEGAATLAARETGSYKQDYWLWPQVFFHTENQKCVRPLVLTAGGIRKLYDLPAGRVRHRLFGFLGSNRSQFVVGPDPRSEPERRFGRVRV